MWPTAVFYGMTTHNLLVLSFIQDWMLLAMNYSKLCLGCCQCCFEHCCPKSSADDVNPLLHYPYQDDRLLPPSIEHRSYAFPQLKRQFSFHPQIEKQFESEGRQIVARQPRHTSIFGSSSTQHASKDVFPSQQTSAEDISSEEEEYSSGHSSLETNDSLEIQSSDSEPRSQRGFLKKMQSIDVETEDTSGYQWLPVVTSGSQWWNTWCNKPQKHKNTKYWSTKKKPYTQREQCHVTKEFAFFCS